MSADEEYEMMSNDDSDASSYHQEMEIVELRLALSTMERQLQQLRDENKNLKDHLQVLCMDQSATTASARKKYALSQNTKDKWAFYHNNKNAIKEETQLDDWRAIKRESDTRFKDFAQNRT